MDGDIADLSQLVKIAKDYNAMLYVDEAHATGLFGSKGYGLTADFANAIDITMGTFSKALGGSGAYIACSNLMKRYLINRCQGFIYSTAPSPLQIAAMHAAWQLIPSHQTQVQTLFKQAQSLRMALKEMGLNTGASTTHIIPIILHFPTQTLAAQRFLAKRGVRVSAIRPPSVSPNQSRLRIALNVTHSAKAIDELKKGLKDFLQNGEIIF
jgi:8-amino-7-oxononanoate synthase